MTARYAQIPGGPFYNDVDEAVLYQRQTPVGVYVNETSQSSGSPATANASAFIIFV